MSHVTSQDLGTKPIGKLLVKQAVPAAIGILVMSLNILVDTIFVGNWIGAIAIAAINVVLPVSFFIAALGMAIGVGGSSIISRALGADNKPKALKTFGNQLSLTFIFTITFAVFGLYFVDTLIPAFGGKGNIFEPAKVYYEIILYGVPVLGFVMLGNNVIRAEGNAKFAMYAMLIPSIGNLVLDYLFINVLNYGMAGAAWATTGSYIVAFLFILWYFLSKHSELKINLSHFGFSKAIVSEIGSLGFVTLARQAVVSVTFLLVNNALYNFGGETSVTTYAIIGRLSMFALFPVFGITQGFIPIAGYNFGAEKYDRVKEVIFTAIKYATILGTIVFIALMFFPEVITKWFTTDADVIKETPNNMRWTFAAVPILALQLIGAAYFQAVGKALPALLLTLTRQAIFFIPLMYILPLYLGEFGIWLSFPIADLLSTLVTAYFLYREVNLNLNPKTTA
ncbi:MATE family efflux transporter [Winogradskyella eckloniae]|uniref:MATE family efflux transporter n=1 Tax=Winogradskyella eckloniae TaxID=1089306 RepID=UPI001567682B|nr:MATE family efflux transporter [Winogradskyella eckloniae]NRD18450.1 MATE family efflux transporter [Winogradskyella eckloniae]